MTNLNVQEMGGAGIGLVSLEFFLRASIKYEKRFFVFFSDFQVPSTTYN